MNWQDLIDNQVHVPPDTRFITGLIGGHRPSTYSASPKVWNAVFARYEIGATYLPFDVTAERFQGFVEALKTDERVRGGNVTIPYKKGVITFLDTVEDFAGLVEAVNTVVAAGGKFSGSNTDGSGLVAAVEEEFDPVLGKNVLQIGAGEAGNAIAYKLVEAGANLRIVNRTPAKAESLAQLINTHLKPKSPVSASGEEKIAEWAPQANLIVNTSTKGFDDLKEVSALWSSGKDNQRKSAQILRQVPKEVAFVDIIFAPAETLMLRRARESGHPTQNGLGMLVHQAALSFAKIFAAEVKEKQIEYSDLVSVMKHALKKGR